MKLSKTEILYRVISGLMDIPLPRDGKTIGIGPFKKEMETAYKLARRVQFAEDNIKEMREAYAKFKEYVDSCH